MKSEWWCLPSCPRQVTVITNHSVTATMNNYPHLCAACHSPHQRPRLRHDITGVDITELNRCEHWAQLRPLSPLIITRFSDNIVTSQLFSNYCRQFLKIIYIQTREQNTLGASSLTDSCFGGLIEGWQNLHTSSLSLLTAKMEQGPAWCVWSFLSGGDMWVCWVWSDWESQQTRGCVGGSGTGTTTPHTGRPSHC